MYNYVSDYNDYSNWRTDALTRCPQGTGKDATDTKKYLLQCVINEEYRLLKPGLDIRSNYEITEREPEPEEEAVDESLSEDVNEGRRLQRVSEINGRRRLISEDLAVLSAGKENPLLKNLYEIEHAISEHKKGSSQRVVF